VGEAELTRALVRPGGLWSRIKVVAETGSTNADVAALARAGTPEGFVLIAESQRAGRGRMGRPWQAPPATALTMSVLLRPRSVAPSRLGWLPLLAGVAVVGACAELPGLVPALKWPNDLLTRATEPGPVAGGWGKCGGILAEAVEPDAVVVGIGINVSQDREQLPPPPDPLAYPPTSLALAGVACEREQLAVQVLRGLSHWYGRWLAERGDPAGSGVLAAYRAHCATLGVQVAAMLPDGVVLRGTATGVDVHGRLVVATDTHRRRLAAGDVHHIRAVSGAVDGPPVQPRVPLAPGH
jgi:BirA family biotin operon repressor/biotin-[acetyl-CoA-carboxylase] ligase